MFFPLKKGKGWFCESEGGLGGGTLLKKEYLKKIHTVFLSVYSEVILSSSSTVNVERSRLQP